MTARNTAHPQGAHSKEVDGYLEAVESGPRRQVLERLRTVIHEAVPGLEETLDFRMPTFRKDGRVVCSLANQKQYMSLYTCGRKCLSAFDEELSHLNCGKCCVRFRKDSDLPSELAARIVKRSAMITAEPN